MRMLDPASFGGCMLMEIGTSDGLLNACTHSGGGDMFRSMSALMRPGYCESTPRGLGFALRTIRVHAISCVPPRGMSLDTIAPIQHPVCDSCVSELRAGKTARNWREVGVAVSGAQD